MAINKIPGVYLSEDVEYELLGSGGKIPVFIGKTGNSGSNDHAVDGSEVLKFKSYDEVKKAPAAGGIGEGTGNVLAAALKDFFEENRIDVPGDVGVPYVYVIDVGDGTAKTAWLAAIESAFSKRDATILAFVGTEDISGNYTVVDLAKATKTAIDTITSDFDLVNAFFTKLEATDAQLIALTDSTNGIQKSRIGICEPDKFGKTIARICLTPYNQEPGFIKYRSVEEGEFKERSYTEKKALQDAGIIFNADERVNDKVYSRINLATATSFAGIKRPADSLFHARFIADEVLRQIQEGVFPFIKANDTTTNIARIQVKVDSIINKFVEKEELIGYSNKRKTGSKLDVHASDKNPYDVIIVGTIQPVNSIGAIEVQEKISVAKIEGGE